MQIQLLLTESGQTKTENEMPDKKKGTEKEIK